MRFAAFLTVIGATVLFCGCGGGSESAPSADASGGAGAPAPPSDAPPGPPADGGGAPPAESPMPAGGETPQVAATTASADGGTPGGSDVDASTPEFFEQNIQTVFATNCFRCHSANARDLKGGLRLDTPEGLRQGGDSGPVIIAGDPNGSILIQALKHDGVKMPPTRKLPDNVVANFTKWVAVGAPDPRPTSLAAADGTTGEGQAVGPDGNPVGPRRPARPKTLRDHAVDALRAGNEKGAMVLLHTHFAIVPEAGAELRDKMNWMPGLRKPALGPRIGIAAMYMNPDTLPRDFDDSPQPIGSSELDASMATFAKAIEDRRSGTGSGTGGDTGEPKRRGRPQPSDSATSGDGSPAPGTGEGGERRGGRGDLTYYTGEMGSKLVDAVTKRIEGGDYGPLYKELAQEASQRGRSDDPNNPGDPNQPGTAEGGNPDIGSPDGGQGGRGGRGPGAGGGKGNSNQLGMGLVWIGKANSRDELNKLVKAADVDLLVTYELTLRPAKNNSFVENRIKMKVTAAKREEVLFTSGTLINRDVMLAREKGIKGDDPVDKEVARVMETLDKACKPEPLPAAVTAEVAKRRVGSLITEKPANPLPAVVEARYYTTKGLLSDEDYATASLALLGEAEYVKLISQLPGAGMGKMVGEAISLSSVANVLHGLNAATGAVGKGARGPAAGGKAAPPRGKGAKKG